MFTYEPKSVCVSATELVISAILDFTIVPLAPLESVIVTFLSLKSMALH